MIKKKTAAIGLQKMVTMFQVLWMTLMPVYFTMILQLCIANSCI